MTQTGEPWQPLPTVLPLTLKTKVFKALCFRFPWGISILMTSPRESRHKYITFCKHFLSLYPITRHYSKPLPLSHNYPSSFPEALAVQPRRVTVCDPPRPLALQIRAMTKCREIFLLSPTHASPLRFPLGTSPQPFLVCHLYLIHGGPCLQSLNLPPSHYPTPQLQVLPWFPPRFHSVFFVTPP